MLNVVLWRFAQPNSDPGTLPVNEHPSKKRTGIALSLGFAVTLCLGNYALSGSAGHMFDKGRIIDCLVK